ncbi:hypothetical protein LOTGIDRAFT_159536 [Lottia gigantea]|uniref:G-protein coupled receptors family 1 profile domain-containing protein n=1 Tax=Lottia gigantea TaxID=225164 RepID=V3ZZ23_LOTGI|nr:hypothetical protein LOTGIDRAFT_159536 [Lottia gigantea]ESO96798.1 hypothetical protein LOTGIDRAFT_159536 [Lottia gigantea]
MNNSSISLSLLVDNTDELEVTRYIVQKLCVPFITTLGLTGNILSILVLTRRCMKSSTNCYLTALAAFDCLYLVFSLTLSFKHYDFISEFPNYWHWFATGRVLTDMSANISVILTVTFTLERYIGVAHPMRGRQLCTPERARIIILIVAVFGIICTSPEFCELKVEEKIVDNKTTLQLRETAFSRSYSYQIGFYWFLVTFFTFLPLIFLCVFNGLLIWTVIRANKLRRTMASNNRHLTERHNRDQHKITKMLIMVVLVFLVCQIPGAVLLMYRTYIDLTDARMTRQTRNSILIAGNITNLLLQINASINFIIYSLISTKFRRVFYRTLCIRYITNIAHSLRHSRHTRTDSMPYSNDNSMRNGEVVYLQRWKKPMVRKHIRDNIHYSIASESDINDGRCQIVILNASICSNIYINSAP